MEKALRLAMEDMGQRLKTLIPIWLLGTGAKFSPGIEPYARPLSFGLLAKLFYQELLDDVNRTREDLIHSVVQMADAMRLECDYQEAEKVVDALLVNTESTKHIFSFQEHFFNEKTMQWELFQFQYLEMDRDATDFEEGTIVYKLSEVAQALFLNTNEIQQQLPISIQQLLVELLIEKGELKVALRMLDSLNHRLITLYKEEKIHKDELIRNPKNTIYLHKNRWGKHLKDVELQFDDEAKKYEKLERIIRKISVSPEHQDTYLQLTKRISKTRINHDKLAKLVIENIRLELQIRTSTFRSMWLTNMTSFRKNIWEDKAQAVGFAHPEDMITLVESLFSPIKPSILPLEWGIEDQMELSNHQSFGNIDKKNGSPLKPVEPDWDSILSLWKPIFEELRDKGRVSLKHLQSIDEFSLARWVQNREAFDYWVAFDSVEEPFVINEENLQSDSDEKAMLLARLLEAYPEEFESLRGKAIDSLPSEHSIILRNKVDVSTFLLTLKEHNDYESCTNPNSII
ncbi:hypothetical protein AA0X95_16545 [Bacillus sp. 1P10SD]|uniref:hypothetical protein n=1 Tax=Bacillus sp. 1P10SD TaxID=3132265 RepID=UPI0039A41E5D